MMILQFYYQFRVIPARVPNKRKRTYLRHTKQLGYGIRTQLMPHSNQALFQAFQVCLSLNLEIPSQKKSQVREPLNGRTSHPSRAEGPSRASFRMYSYVLESGGAGAGAIMHSRLRDRGQ
jgi:hypothetical protein